MYCTLFQIRTLWYHLIVFTISVISLNLLICGKPPSSFPLRNPYPFNQRIKPTYLTQISPSPQVGSSTSPEPYEPCYPPPPPLNPYHQTAPQKKNQIILFDRSRPFSMDKEAASKDCGGTFCSPTMKKREVGLIFFSIEWGYWLKVD